MDVNGFTAPGFEAVAEAFARNFTEFQEVGAAFAAYRDAELVVDLWGGVADPQTGRPWQADTLQLLFSGTKGLTAACVLLLAERGQLDLDAPAARYWPEFAAAGKGAITVAEIMSHQARLPGVREPFSAEDMLDPRLMAKLLAEQEPLTDPRAGFTYHALTYGWLAGELVHRVDGRTLGAFFADEFARPLELEVWLGVPDDLHPRVSTMVAGPGFLTDPDQPPSGDPLRDLTRSPLTTADAPALWNSAGFRRAEIAGVNAHGTARSMARFYACLARGGELDGVRVLKESTLELGRRERRRGVEPLWDGPIAFATGFELQTEQEIFGPVPDAFGHAGAGGSRHGAWPADRVGLSYAMNQARTAPDPRPACLLTALHTALRALEPSPGA
ncbi:serine hydrolase domain-containing protein [Streptosporangium carneum]|uniref:Serine hydrolase n=1 Tax=Streptosporangium carneum TaxID=47481 RepID=A0A9W6I6R2_9ACTN|nr:serine hydrolase domain-containing protein [Streptosporangium carneum]GLK12663.1 serine hydrolase [Streptosporangium carneum]